MTWVQQCRLQAVNEDGALDGLGVSRQILRGMLYEIIRECELTPTLQRIKSTIVESLEIEQPDPSLPSFSEVTVTKTSEAIRIIRERALASVPVVSANRITMEHEHIKPSWNGPPVRTGTPDQILKMAQENLECMSRRPEFTDYSVKVLRPAFCVQAVSHFRDSFTPMRLYRAEDGRLSLIGTKGMTS